MRRIFIILLWLQLNILIIGVKAEGNVTLKIIGMDLKPIKGAQVKVVLCNEIRESGADGIVEISLCTKKCTVAVRHKDYFELDKVLSESDADKVIEIKLMPLIKQTEELVISATRYPERGIDIPVIENVLVASEIERKGPANIEMMLSNAISVASIGSGGYSKVSSIRGLARKRILLLVDNARINSDRRTGPGASFVMPEDVESIEIIRNASAVFYGSDAIGGVINLITRKPDLSSKFNGKLRLKYGFNNKEKQAGVSLNFAKKKSGLYVSLQGIDAENYKTSEGEILDSYFSSYGIFSKYIYLNDKRDIEFSLLINRGIDIGKPSINSISQPTWYPKETHNLFNFYWQENLSGSNKFNFRFFIDPNRLETHKDIIEDVDRIKTKESISINESTDYGLQISYYRFLNEKSKISIGLDYFGRINVNADNTNEKFDNEGNIINTSFYSSIRNGKRSDYGIFVSFDSEWRNISFDVGARYDYFKLSADYTEFIDVNKFSSDAATGFVAALYKFPKDIIFIGRVGRAYRLPGLSERFYVGITGRGYVIGEPNLSAEKSINFDMGIKVVKRNYYAGVYGFYYKIDDMVERYKVTSNIYTYGNIESGVIKGFEGEIEFYPMQGLKVYASIMNYLGKSKAGDYLNDIPPFRVISGVKLFKGRYWVEVEGIYQHRHTRIGPAEIKIPTYTVLNLVFGINVRNDLTMNFQIYNLFNRLYLGRPDPESVYEPGYSLSVSIGYRF